MLKLLNPFYNSCNLENYILPDILVM